MKLWDLETCEEKLTPKGHTDWVASIALSPDEKVLGSAGHDHTVRLWRAATKEEVEATEW